jgi:hypothetical protein
MYSKEKEKKKRRGRRNRRRELQVEGKNTTKVKTILGVKLRETLLEIMVSKSKLHRKLTAHALYFR